MPWAKVDDGWWCHPKTVGLTLAARGLWVTALSWSCQHRTPHVPAPFLAMAGASNEEANALVAAGLWVAEEGGWRIHDWDDYQERSLSEKRAEAGRKGGLKSRPPKQPASTERSNVEATGEAGPVPSRPDPEVLPSQSDTTTRPQGPVDDGRNHGTGTIVDGACAVIARWALEDRRKAAGLEPVRSEASWLRQAEQRARSDHAEAAGALVDAFVIDDPHTLAEVLTGKRAKTYLDRRPRLAVVADQ